MDIGHSELHGRIPGGDNRRRFSGITDVLGTDDVKQQNFTHLLGFDGVAGHNHVHVRQAGDLKQRFQFLMCGAVRADRDTTVCADYQDVEVAIADGNSQLVQITCRRKDTVSTEDRNLALFGQPDGNGGSVLFGHADGYEAPPSLGMFLVELRYGNGVGDVGPDTDHPFVIAVFVQSATHTFAGRVHLDLHLVGTVPPEIAGEFRHFLCQS